MTTSPSLIYALDSVGGGQFDVSSYEHHSGGKNLPEGVGEGWQNDGAYGLDTVSNNPSSCHTRLFCLVRRLTKPLLTNSRKRI